MKLNSIKEELNFVKTVLSKKEISDNRYNFNYIKIEPEGERMYIIATDGFRMSTIEMPRIVGLTETIFIHKNEPVDVNVDSRVERNIPFPDGLSVYRAILDSEAKAVFRLSPSIIDLLKSVRYKSEYYKNPSLKFNFNHEGIFITELKINKFVLKPEIQVIKSPYYFGEYAGTLKEPFEFSINAKFLLDSLEKYFQGKLASLFQCKIVDKIFVIEAKNYKKTVCDMVMGIGEN